MDKRKKKLLQSLLIFLAILFLISWYLSIKIAPYFEISQQEKLCSQEEDTGWAPVGPIEDAVISCDGERLKADSPLIDRSYDKSGYTCYCHTSGTCWDGKACIDMPGNCEDVDWQEVDKKASEIENGKNQYTTSQKDIFGRSTEGGYQVDYFLNNEIILTEQTFFGETGKADYSYYYKNGETFYIIRKFTNYTLPIYMDPKAGIKDIEMSEFYLDDDQNLCFWGTGVDRQENDQNTKDLIQSLLSGL